MVSTDTERPIEVNDAEKLEFYRLIGEGYKAIQEGRVSTIDDVREKKEEIILRSTLW